MLRIKAIYRARAIPTPGVSVYRASQRKQWLAKLEGGARVRAASLLTELDGLLDARAVGASVTAKPVNTTFYEIAHARRFQRRENAILSPAAQRLAAMLREKYRHLGEQ